MTHKIVRAAMDFFPRLSIVQRTRTAFFNSINETFCDKYMEVVHALRGTALRFVWLALFLFCSLPSSLAQITTVTADQAPPIPAAGHNYIKLMNETLSPATGAVDLQFGVGVPPGRDLAVPFAIGYDSNSARHFNDGTNVPFDNGGYLAQGGWRYIVPSLQYTTAVFPIYGSGGSTIIQWCDTIDHYMFTDPAGTLYPLGLNQSPLNWQNCTGQGLSWLSPLLQNSNGLFTATTTALPSDSFSSPKAPPVSIFDTDGTLYSFSNTTPGRVHGYGKYWSLNVNGNPLPGTDVSHLTGLPDFIETRNGNEIVFTDDDSYWQSSGAFHVTDTLGRTAVTASGFGSPSGDTVTVSGLAQPYKLTWGTANFNWTYNAHIVAPPLSSYWYCAAPNGTSHDHIGKTLGPDQADRTATVSGSGPVVTGLQLPNGLSYQFLYDNPNNDNPFGLVREIIYPNGAYVRYVWTQNPASTQVTYQAFNVPPTPPGPNTNQPTDLACEGIFDVPAVAKRFVSFDGVHEVQEQDFSYSTTWKFTDKSANGYTPYQTWTQKQTTVVTKDLVTGTSFRTVYTYVPIQDAILGNDPQGAISATTGVYPSHPGEKTIQYYDTNGALLRTVTKRHTYEYVPPDVLTTLDNGQSSYVNNVYGSSPNIPGDIFEYDYGTQADSNAPGPHGPLLRHIHFDYNHAFPLNPLMPAITATTPFNNAILDRPSDVITYNGAQNKVAEVDYFYDETAIASASATGHDDRNFGPGFQSGRGNVTTKVVKCFSGVSQTACPQGDSVTAYTYDQTGQQISKKDPNGNTTSYSFADSFFDPAPPSNATSPPGSTDAYLTKVTYPSTNGVSHSESFSYAYSDGSLTRLTDENGNQTKYTYNDTLRRLTETDFPDGGQTTVTYNDAGASANVVTSKKIDSSHTLTATVVADGMGHPVQTQLNSDPAGVDYTDTTYDGLGQVISASNPYRSTSAATDGVRQTQYDSLGRVTQVTNQDGSVRSISYVANCSIAVDEAGKRRRSCHDPLGRLIEVDEPTPGTPETIQATNATATVTLSGSLESKPSSNPATGTVTISGTDSIVPGTSAYDFGTVTVTIGNASVSTSYGNNGSAPSAASDVASALCSQITSTSSTNSQVSCTTNGGVINLTAQAPGTVGNGIALAVRAQSLFPQSNQSAFASSFTSGSLSGCCTPTYDSGTVSFWAAGSLYTVYWGGSYTRYGYGTNIWFISGPSTASVIASGLAAAINNDPSAYVTASASGGAISLTAKDLGLSGNNISLACGSSFDATDFSTPSFSIACPSSLSGGHEAGSLSAPMVTLYSYDALGNLLRVDQKGSAPTDSTQWRTRLFTYDSLSRLLTANNPESGVICYGTLDGSGNCLNNGYDADNNLIYKTDARGTRTTFTYDALNRITGKSYSDSTRGASYTYDQTGLWGVNETNTVGRLVVAYDGWHAGTLFSYDAMGRTIEQWDCPPSAWLVHGGCYTVNAQYDLAGNLTQLTYPDGRVVNNHYNIGSELNQVQLSGGSNYWSVNDTDFLANGTPKVVTLGNGVTETTTLNNRLQLGEGKVSNTGIGTLADHTYSYGTQNNGNVLSVADQLNSSLTQTFTYDALNRLATAGESGSRWGLSFTYDSWGNFLNQNVTAGSANSHQFTVGTNNRLNGYSYDAAGNMLSDTFHNYTFDAESRISQVDSGATVYTYDPTAGARVRKDTGSNYTEYFYFGSEIVAELDQAGHWSDYIFADGKRIAKADGFDRSLRLTGQMCGNCGWQWFQWGFNNLGWASGHVIQTGDSVRWVQYNTTGTVGGIIMTFTDGTDSITTGQILKDQHGEYIFNGTQPVNQWDYRIADLSPVVGKAIAQIRLYVDGMTTPGSFNEYFQDVVFTGADGRVQAFFNHDTTPPSTYTIGSSGVTQTSAIINYCLTNCNANSMVTYYHGDQIGSSRLITNGYGYPDWQATYLPYGEEYNAEITAEHYKFTGKERDGESGLDYFGARYYGSTLGRFITPDWSGGPTAVPYADFGNPQSLNLYGYVGNNPLSRADKDGHCWHWLWGGHCPEDPPPPPPPPAPKPPAVITPGTPQNKLAKAQDDARADPNLQPTPPGPDRKTFCNIATCQIVKATGTTTDGLVNEHGQPNLANTDAQTLANSPSWHQVTPQEAQNLANQGVTVVGVISETGHGHIATVRPELLPGTQDVAAHGPLVNNIGAHVGVTNGNNAFGGATPTYYAPTNNQNHAPTNNQNH